MGPPRGPVVSSCGRVRIGARHDEVFAAVVNTSECWRRDSPDRARPPSGAWSAGGARRESARPRACESPPAEARRAPGSRAGSASLRRLVLRGSISVRDHRRPGASSARTCAHPSAVTNLSCSSIGVQLLSSRLHFLATRRHRRLGRHFRRGPDRAALSPPDDPSRCQPDTLASWAHRVLAARLDGRAAAAGASRSAVSAMASAAPSTGTAVNPTTGTWPSSRELHPRPAMHDVHQLVRQQPLPAQRAQQV